MTQELTPTNADSTWQPPAEISEENWVATPNSVQKLVMSLSEISDEDKANIPVSVHELLRSLIKERLTRAVRTKIYDPTWSTPFMVFANVIIVIGLTFLLGRRVVVQCISPPGISAISAAIVLPVVFHLFWRNIYHTFVPSNYQETIREAIKIGVINVPITYIITFFNEIQPWRLSSRLLGLLLFILLAGSAFLNFSPYSLFYVADEPSLQGFSIERLDKPTERLALDQSLTIEPGEKVFVEAILLGGIDASCIWSTAMNDETENKNCSTVFSIRPGTKQDVLTVIVQPVCGTRQESVNLPVVVQAEQN